MKIYLTDQKNNFNKHLNILKTSEVIPYDKNRLTAKVTTIDINTFRKIEHIDLGFIFDYHIFPGNIMTFQTQWDAEHRKMKLGDTIVQQVYIPPTRIFSQKIIFGVRINEIIDEPDKKGFSYETLCGHVEKGISTFTIEQLDDNLIFNIQTYSTPGNMLTKLLGPIFSIPYQTFCTRAALTNVKEQIEKQRKLYEFNSFEDYWKLFDKLIALLNIDNKQQITIELKEAQKYVNGLTDGWFDFKLAFERSLHLNKSKMTAEQLDIADFLVYALTQTLTNR